MGDELKLSNKEQMNRSLAAPLLHLPFLLSLASVCLETANQRTLPSVNTDDGPIMPVVQDAP